jgi:glucose-1-phosphate cytidylyltransferase
MQTVVLCGGMGTRAYPHTTQTPKALLPVNGRPILEHVLTIYELQGHTDFILALGHLKEAIIAHFQAAMPSDLRIEFVDTGASSDTGERVRRCAHLLDSTFFVTYCDGLSDIDLASLLDQHQRSVAHGGLATITTVPLRSQYGILETDGDDQVIGFQEKPMLSQYWMNGGFFVFEKQVFDHWQGQNLEQEVLPHLAAKGLLYCYRHTAFWKSMDTYKEQLQMSEVWHPVLTRLLERYRPAHHGEQTRQLGSRSRINRR